MQRCSLFITLALAACSREAPKPNAEVSTVTKATAMEEGDCHHDEVDGTNAALKRGEPLKGAPTVALSELLATPEKYDAQTVLTEGTIRQVCQKAGCWMELAADDKGPGARVTFKDYAFFVPKDAQKSHAKVEGHIKLAELSEARAKHYADEGATVPRGRDGKAREVQIVASGVEIRK